MRKQFSALSALLIMVASLLLPTAVTAAPQTFNQMGSGQLTYTASDNPRLNADPATTATFNGLGIPHGSEGSPAQTTTDSNSNQIYTWRLEDLSSHICSNAVLTSLHIQANVSVSTAGDPDLSALSVYRVDGSDIYNLDDYTVIDGVDYAATTGFATPPNNGGISGIVRGSAPAFGGALPGGLEGEWDLSSYDVNDTFGIMIQQDSQDGTTDLTTAINVVDINYDDSACLEDAAITKTLLNPQSVKPGGTASYEIRVTNNGTDPIDVGDGNNTTVFDIAPPELTYVSSSGNGFQCNAAGKFKDLLSGNPSELNLYRNHLEYSLLFCDSSPVVILQPGESVTFVVNFTVAQSAKTITNFALYGIDGNKDPGAVEFYQAASVAQSGDSDVFDILISRQADIDNFAVSTFTFSSTTNNNVSLANTGSSIRAYVIIGVALSLVGSCFFILTRSRSGKVFSSQN